MKVEALLNESVGAGYIDRNWPPAFTESGAWPLASLRQSFLNGALTRLLDPDRVLRGKVAEFVENGDFGLASGPRADGSYEHLWFDEQEIWSAGADRYGRLERDVAVEWLCDVLAAGPVASKELLRQARESGLSERTLRRAAAQLGIRPTKDAGGAW